MSHCPEIAASSQQVGVLQVGPFAELLKQALPCRTRGRGDGEREPVPALKADPGWGTLQGEMLVTMAARAGAASERHTTVPLLGVDRYEC